LFARSCIGTKLLASANVSSRSNVFLRIE
jgi:hypothetical protein